MSEGIYIRSSSDLILAIKGMLVQMNREQRKSFLLWVKERRKEYDFNFPQGYIAPKESANAQSTTQLGSNDVNSQPSVVQPIQQPGIVGADGVTIVSEGNSKGASA